MTAVHLKNFWKELISNPQARPLLIDVRSESEFAHDGLDSAINLPILNDVERHEVGKIYAEQGNAAATELGFNLVSGAIKAQRIENWIQAAKRGAEFLSCWRGGLRSKIAETWLRENGVPLQRIEGGTRAIRARCLKSIESLTHSHFSYCVHGRTGSGKTRLLKGEAGFLDLEAYANHRGSSFGGVIGEPQPTQIQFENRIGIHADRIRENKIPILVEGESRLIGRCAIPLSLFNLMRELPVIYLEESVQARALLIYEDYVEEPMKRQVHMYEVVSAYRQALLNIQKRLGGVKYQSVLEKLNKAFVLDDRNLHLEWIEELLVTYYDKLYDHTKTLSDPRLVFSGNAKEVSEFLKYEEISSEKTQSAQP